MKWGSKIEVERRNRIRCLLWAYAYEFKAAPIVDDATFDKLCYTIDTDIKTGNRKMDSWFKREFSPYTGQWIHKLPRVELTKLEHIYKEVYGTGN